MEDQPSSPPSAQPDQSVGCLQTILMLFMAAWILVATGVAQSITWVLEQQIFQGPLKTPDYRWVAVLVYGLAILFPAVIIWAAGIKLPQRRFFLAFVLAGVFVIFQVPTRLFFMTHAQLVALLQMAGALVFLFIFWNRQPAQAGWRGIGLALLVAGVLSYPWVLWGALGSAWDTVLNLGAALLFGVAASQVAARIFARDEAFPPAWQTLLLEGAVMALALLVMVTGLGVNGNQGLLSLVVPVLGWALAALYQHSSLPDGRSFTNWPVLALLAGLAAFWPMAFIDPDELAAVISLGAGELIQWANQAAAVGLAIGIAAGLVLLFARAPLLRAPAGRGAPIGRVSILAGAAWVVALVLYAGRGQPGLYGERLFVILKDQADLTSVSQIRDYKQRRSAAYQALVAKADAGQAELRKTFDFWHIAYQPYYLENAIEVQAGPLVRWWLLSRPEVDRVLDNPIMRPLPAPLPESRGGSSAPNGVPWNLHMIGADKVWNELKVTGKGIIIGQSDSGADGAHPELADSYRGQGGQNDYNWFDPWYHTAAPTDIGGHGTHTLGIALGDHVGVAPDAEWIGCVNLARNLGSPALYLDCMQFMLAPFPQNGDPLHAGRPDLGAHVLNNSWGCPPAEGCDPGALLPAVAALRAAGVFVVASAGNDGQSGCGSVAEPLALYAQVYSVGAIDEQGQLASFSSTGPVDMDGSKRVKPDIAAPGVGVLSSFPDGTYAALDGTSMAGPHLVGVVALMWSANPALIGDIDRTQQILDETAAAYQGPLPQCVSSGHPNDAVGYGVVDAYQAVLRAMGK